MKCSQPGGKRLQILIKKCFYFSVWCPFTLNKVYLIKGDHLRSAILIGLENIFVVLGAQSGEPGGCSNKSKFQFLKWKVTFFCNRCLFL